VADEGSIRSRTSLRLDRQKVADVRDILGTKTLVDTVDAALEHIINVDARRRLMERTVREGGIEPTPAELRRR
jgi:Arc/MetJ family transcription regulator